MKLTLCLLALVAVLPAWGDLKFEKRITSHTVKAEEDQFTATFKFTNAGNSSVEVKKVDSDCGCIKAEADKQFYKKGEAGTITAVFSVGSFEGTQNKTVWVVYAGEAAAAVPAAPPKPKAEPLPLAEGADPNQAPLVADDAPEEPAAPAVAAPLAKTEKLTVSVTVPVVLEITPKITKWKQGDQPEAKTVVLEMKHEKPIQVKEVRSSRDNMKVEVKTVEEGKRYELVLTPQSTAEPQLGMLTIVTDCEIEKHQRKLAFYTIERVGNPLPAPAPAAK